MTAAPIEALGLTKTYRIGFALNRTVRALQNLDLKVEAGAIYGLLGPNGAGKSTTIKILLNLVQPSAGTATLFGRPVSDRASRQQVGFVPENPAPYEYLTGLEFVRLCGRLSGLSGHELDVRSKRVLDKVGLSRAQGLQIRRYSKGMIQRVALAQAIIAEPDLLILDEPTSGLDPVGRREMRDLILEERDRGVTVLFCTHIIPDVEAVCDRIAVLVGGVLQREGGVRELLHADSELVELVIETSTEPSKLGLGPDAAVRRLGDRLAIRVKESAVQPMIKEILASGGRLIQLQPVRFNLEDLFLKVLASSGAPKVGSEIEG